MYRMTLMILLAGFLPGSLQQWYSSCRTGDWDDAAELAGELLAEDPGNTDALAAELISTIIEGGFSSDGSLMDSFAPDSVTSLARTAMGAIFAFSPGGFLEDAEYQLMESVEMDPENVISWYLLGRIKNEYGAYNVSLRHFQKALELDPGFLPARLEIARIRRDEGNLAEASVDLREIAGSGSAAGMLARAEYILLAESEGDDQLADSLEGSMGENAADAWFRLALDQLHQRSGVAHIALSRADSVSDSISVELAWLYLELNDHMKAIEISKDLLQAGTGDSTMVLQILGTAHQEKGSLGAARECFQLMLQRDSLSVPALNHLGEIAESEGRTEEAVNYYLKVLEQDIYDQTARAHLREIAGDTYDPESIAETNRGLSMSASADMSVERGGRAFFEWGGSAYVSYRFDVRGTSFNSSFGGRSVTWEENYGSSTDTLNTNRGWASVGFDYWFTDMYYAEVASSWDRQMYTERPWQVSSYFAIGLQKRILSWFRFSPELGLGVVNTKWDSGLSETYTDDFSVFTSVSLWYRKPHTFIRQVEISGSVYFPPDNPENFISSADVYLTMRALEPFFIGIGYSVDYTRTPVVSSWKKFNTSFTTSINLDLY